MGADGDARREGGDGCREEEESGLWMSAGWLLVKSTAWTELLYDPYMYAYNPVHSSGMFRKMKRTDYGL